MDGGAATAQMPLSDHVTAGCVINALGLHLSLSQYSIKFSTNRPENNDSFTRAVLIKSQYSDYKDHIKYSS